MSDKELKLRAMLNKYDIPFTDATVNGFISYFEMLVEKNKVMNLTAITEFDDVLLKHFSDSVSVVMSFPSLREYFSSGSGFSFIDIGTGAGFPGIPLKLIFPSAKVTLMDSLGKRVVFLNDVISELGLTNIEAVNMRAEDAGILPEYREKYDFCFCRAVAKLNIISEYAVPLVKKDGYFIPYKSGNIEEECLEAKNAFNKLGVSLEGANPIILPDSDISRTHVLLHKVKTTDKIYPRSNSKIKKNPL